MTISLLVPKGPIAAVSRRRWQRPGSRDGDRICFSMLSLGFALSLIIRSILTSICPLPRRIVPTHIALAEGGRAERYFSAAVAVDFSLAVLELSQHHVHGCCFRLGADSGVTGHACSAACNGFWLSTITSAAVKSWTSRSRSSGINANSNAIPTRVCNHTFCVFALTSTGSGPNVAERWPPSPVSLSSILAGSLLCRLGLFRSHPGPSCFRSGDDPCSALFTHAAFAFRRCCCFSRLRLPFRLRPSSPLSSGNPGSSRSAHAPSTSLYVGFGRGFSSVVITGSDRPQFGNFLIYSGPLLLVSFDRSGDNFISQFGWHDSPVSRSFSSVHLICDYPTTLVLSLWGQPRVPEDLRRSLEIIDNRRSFASRADSRHFLERRF